MKYRLFHLADHNGIKLESNKNKTAGICQNIWETNKAILLTHGSKKKLHGKF